VVHKSKIIDRVDIDRQAATNLRELLDNQLNMSVKNDNVLGSSISMQGISGQNIKILIDGVPVIGRLNGNIDLSQINLNNIERVEIIEGPLSVDFGTDALAGTINLITNKSQYDKASSSINLYYETVGHYNSDINFSLKRTTIFFLLVEEETILMVGPKGMSLALFLLLN
jgi:outer membrane receptor for ferrienterochelin and colicins